MARTNFANKVHGEPGAKPAKPMAAPAAAPSKMEEPEADATMNAHSHMGGEHDVSEMPIQDVVAEHGPATHMFSEHTEDGNHHVHSVHGKKHHHSDHESHGAAHQHMGEAMGTGEMGEEGEDPSPFAGKQSDAEEELEDTVSHGRAHKGMGLK